VEVQGCAATVIVNPSRKSEHQPSFVSKPLFQPRVARETIIPMTSNTICPGLFTPILAPDGILCRLRIPGGQLTATQLEQLANFCQNFQITHLQITNRANLQLRNVPPDTDFSPLQTAGLTGSIPGTDHLRNIMISPLAGFDAQAQIDTRLLVPALDRLLSNWPDLIHLSPKFSIGLDGGERLSVRSQPNDLRFLCHDGAFHLQLADQTFRLLPQNTVQVVQALIEVYLYHVDRHLPKPPRFAKLLTQVGMEAFVRAIAPWTTAVPNDETTEERSQTMPVGLYGDSIALAIPLGQISVKQLRGLATLVTHSGAGLLHLTPWRNLVLPGMGDLEGVDRELHRLQLSRNRDNPWRFLIACSGSTGCASGLADVQADAQHLAQLPNLTQTTIHLSGCDKFCAHRGVSDLTLVGVAPETYEVRRGKAVIAVLPRGEALAQVQTQLIKPSAPDNLRQWAMQGMAGGKV
jgi:ferredoxin-nitrite reductase